MALTAEVCTDRSFEDAGSREHLTSLREVAAEFAQPVMLYSIGKDSSVMLRLAQKAFYPGHDSLSAAAHRHQLQVPRDDRVPRLGIAKHDRRAS